MRYQTPCPECGGFDATPELTQGMSLPQCTGRRRCFCGHVWTPSAAPIYTHPDDRADAAIRDLGQTVERLSEDRLVARVLREVAAACAKTKDAPYFLECHPAGFATLKELQGWIEARAKELEQPSVQERDRKANAEVIAGDA